MKILILNYEFPPLCGGGGNASYYLAKELTKRGNTVHVLTSGLPKEEIVDGIKVFKVPGRKKATNSSVYEMLGYIINASIRVPSLIKKECYDIIHAFFAIPTGLVSLFLKKFYNQSYIVSLRGSDVPGFRSKYFMRGMYYVTRPFFKKILLESEQITTVSNDLKKIALLNFKKAVPLEFSMIPNGVDCEKFRCHITEKKADKKIEILSVTRIQERKGLQFLIESARLLRKKIGASFRIKIVGDGKYKKNLQKLVRKYHLEDLVVFKGYVQHNSLPHIYANADIFVLPSSAEGSCNVILEALASGLPVITTPVGGNTDLIMDGVNGFFVKLGGIKELSEKLLILLNDKSLRKKMGKASRKIAEKKFSWEKITDKYLKVYQNFINSRKIDM